MAKQSKRKRPAAKLPPQAKVARGNAGEPTQTHATDAEQTRESQESGKALNAEASIRGRMIKIGRANRQTGRQGS